MSDVRRQIRCGPHGTLRISISLSVSLDAVVLRRKKEKNEIGAREDEIGDR
jgi:hypothetical protein